MIVIVNKTYILLFEILSCSMLHHYEFNLNFCVSSHRGPAVVVVSCVEEKEPYRCHPHKLVGKDGMCKKGVCSMDINTPDMTATFQVQ